MVARNALARDHDTSVAGTERADSLVCTGVLLYGTYLPQSLLSFSRSL
ncbi:hypothetical protein SAMN04515672_3213 [Natronorubrum texcoconense]|uniref:Uncharacterized protein n=1 Tax=Natronorubrum texcoconense TaxID=1095776 RepID=A0A1G9C4N0_9EURY|nr:hypothetical protein SAMN04515672_3213 [Natronorubrum texcoconense]